MKHHASRYSLSLKVILVCLALLGIQACAPQASAPSEIPIGLITVLTGDLKDSTGVPTVNGANLALKAVNDSGGLDIGGRKYKITLLVEDDQDKAELATSAAQKLINQGKVVALISPSLSRNAIPVTTAAETAGIPSISPLSTNPATTANKKFAFRVAFLDPFQGQVIARFAKDELKAQKAAVLYDVASAYNKGIAEVFQQAFTEGGGQVTAFESYTTGEKDFTEQLKRIKDSGATVLFLPNYEDEVPEQAKQAHAMGITATLLGSDTWGNVKAAEQQLLDGGFFSRGWSPELQSDQSQAFVKAYRQAYGQDPNEDAATTYDAMNLLLQALKSQGKTDPTAIRDGIAATNNYAGVTGSITYQGSGDPVKSAVISQVKDGKFVLFKVVNP